MLHESSFTHSFHGGRAKTDLDETPIPSSLGQRNRKGSLHSGGFSKSDSKSCPMAR